MGDFWQININSILMILGWIIGAIIVVIKISGTVDNLATKSMGEINHLANEIGLLRGALVTMTSRIDEHERDISFLRGVESERRNK